MIIGICGKSGSGKSTLAYELERVYGYNAAYLDIDKVGHKVLENNEIKEELCKTFGKDVIENGKISRKKLGEIVFAKREEMDKLSEITWKYMEIEIDKFIKNNSNDMTDKIVILDWLLLPLTKFYNMCDMKILVELDYEERKKRAMLRDNITEEEFDLRESASIEYNKEDFDIVSGNEIELIRKPLRKVPDLL
jgi:dephospho-CoA kinase